MDVIGGVVPPQYFVNQVIVMRTIGPCVQFVLGAAYDHAVEIVPEVDLIIPRDCALDAAMKTIDFLRATMAVGVIPIHGRLMS